MSKKCNTKTIRMDHGRIVIAKLPNGDQYYLESHNEGISIITKNNDRKVITVQRFCPDAIVVKQK